MKRVLVIEDNAHVAETIVESLRMRGCHVEHAATAAAAAPLLQQEWDVVVSDYELGDGFGTFLIDGYTGGGETILFSGLDRTREIAAECPNRKPDRQVSKSDLVELVRDVAA